MSLTGELDYAAEHYIRSQYAPAIEGDTGTVVVGCAAVTFLDSAGIRGLVSARQALPSQGRDLRLENLGRASRRALEICGLLDILNVGEP